MSNTRDSQNPNFISLEEAAEMTEGTRVTFIPGMQALYAEALKNICFVKRISLIRALHPLCLLYTSPSPRDKRQSRMPSSA